MIKCENISARTSENEKGNQKEYLGAALEKYPGSELDLGE
jgi:hypothetical protein